MFALSHGPSCTSAIVTSTTAATFTAGGRSSGIEGLHSKNINADKSMVRGYVQQYAAEITTLIGKVDRQLLMLFKTNDCLR